MMAKALAYVQGRDEVDQGKDFPIALKHTLSHRIELKHPEKHINNDVWFEAVAKPKMKEAKAATKQAMVVLKNIKDKLDDEPKAARSAYKSFIETSNNISAVTIVREFVGKTVDGLEAQLKRYAVKEFRKSLSEANDSTLAVNILSMYSSEMDEEDVAAFEKVVRTRYLINENDIPLIISEVAKTGVTAMTCLNPVTNTPQTNEIMIGHTRLHERDKVTDKSGNEIIVFTTNILARDFDSFEIVSRFCVDQ